jgi:DNA-binding NarL/FixJ family response regulator
VAVLLLITYATDEWVFDAIRAGTVGYLLKDIRRDDLVRAIEDTAQGKTHLAPNIAGKLMAQIAQTPAPKSPHLTQSASLEEQLTGRE